jgi:hypothetical protein
MAQSTREYVAIYQLHTDGADARAVFRRTGLARCLPSLRHQIAVARTLLDELEDGIPSSFVRGASAQAVEELIRLGSRVLDAAAILAQHEAENEGNRSE